MTNTAQTRQLGGPKALLLVALMAAAGCSSSVTSEQNSAIPIPSGATVAFRGSASDGNPRVDPAVSNDSIHQMIQRAIVTQLQAKGYTVVDSGQPSNFTVRYYLELATTTGYAPTAGGVSGPAVGGYRGYGYGYGQDAQAGLAAAQQAIMEKASFGVDLVDEKAGRTVWRGAFEREPKSKAPDEARVNKVVADVMKSLPRVP
jgi:hypothetical protein